MLNKCIRQLPIFKPTNVKAYYTPSRMLMARPFSTIQFQSQSSGHQEQQGFKYSHFFIPAIALTSYLYLQNSDPSQAHGIVVSEEDNKIGSNENHVRINGTPHEIYKQFASEKMEDGCPSMTYKDFFKALTPYNYQGLKNNNKYFDRHRKHIDQVMHIADVDEDGRISFMEFFFFVLVSQTPSRLIKADFTRAGGCLNAAQLSKTMSRHRKRTTFGQMHTVNERTKNHNAEDFQEVSRQMCLRIFAGKDHIHFQDYMEFRNELQEMLWHYEFHQFETDAQEHISTYDFAQSLFVYYVPMHKISDYLEHLEEQKEALGVETCCDVAQYCAFQYFLKQKTKIIQTVMAQGEIDFDGLRKLTNDFESENEFCKKHGVHIPNGMLTAFLHAFDLDGNGVLDAEETVGIITSRKEMGSRNLRKQE